MDYLKLTAKELKNAEKEDLVAAEKDIRKQLAELRMDIYTASAANLAKKKKLKRSLARLLTVRNETKVVEQQQAN